MPSSAPTCVHVAPVVLGATSRFGDLLVALGDLRRHFVALDFKLGERGIAFVAGSLARQLLHFSALSRDFRFQLRQPRGGIGVFSFQPLDFVLLAQIDLFADATAVSATSSGTLAASP